MINKIFNFAVVLIFSSILGMAQESVPMSTIQTAQPIKLTATRLPKSQQSKNKKAQAKYFEGESANENDDFKSAAQNFRQAIEIDPDFFAAHEAFIKANIFIKMLEADTKTPLPGQKNPTGLKTRAMPLGGGPATEILTEIYKRWLETYPQKPVMHWGLGYVSLKIGNTKPAADLYRQALDINKEFAPAYDGLAMVSTLNKDQAGYRENLRLAYEYDKTARRLSNYAGSLREVDPKIQKSLYEQIVKQFPTDKAAYYALMSLSNNSTEELDKLNYLEKAWRMFPDEDSIGHNYSMQALFGMLSLHKPKAALELANAMMKVFPNEKAWKPYATFQAEMIKGEKLVKAKKYDEAIEFLKKIDNTTRVDLTAYYLLQALAEGGGDTQRSYGTLLKAAAPKFNFALNKALATYATKIGKTNQQMEDDLWQLRVANAKMFKDFELVRHDTNQPVKLSDYRGKVVFVSFWFPGCGPCIAEFPYLKAAMDKFKSQGLEMLFINIVQKDDAQALPVLGEHKMDVISLKIPVDKWATKEYGVTGAPSNFLLDTEGRIIFQPRVNSPSEIRDFEKQVELLIARRKMGSMTTTTK